jgi:BirA family biotin operon repressor/biotin-[acetyl-CoA-carboxylase] ligase
MDIKHLHLNKTESTQKDLKELVKSNKLTPNSPYLISTDNQVTGVGRQGSQWVQVEKAIAFSFIINPSQTLTLTPLEVGVQLADYFSSRIKLKWPNDLLNEKNEKVGGIICQYYKDLIIAGVGLNLTYIDDHSFPYPVGGVYSSEHKLSHDFKEKLPLEIYKHILENRLSDYQIREDWNKFCAHKEKQVTVTDNNIIVSGNFHSIGENGEAIIQDNQGNLKKVLTGSLRFII